MNSRDKLTQLANDFYSETMPNYDSMQYFKDIDEDLEKLEELEKLMGTPIQDIMKRLKFLEILKKHIKLIDYGFFYDKIVIYLPVNYREQLKEWLENEKSCNKITQIRK